VCYNNTATSCCSTSHTHIYTTHTCTTVSTHTRAVTYALIIPSTRTQSRRKATPSRRHTHTGHKYTPQCYECIHGVLAHHSTHMHVMLCIVCSYHNHAAATTYTARHTRIQQVHSKVTDNTHRHAHIYLQKRNQTAADTVSIHWYSNYSHVRIYATIRQTHTRAVTSLHTH